MKTLPLLLIAALVGVLYLQWLVIPARPPQPAPAPAPASAHPMPEEQSTPPEHAPQLPGLALDPAAFEVIVQRPLFLKDRRPPDEEAEPVPADQERSDLEGLDLTAVLITPEGAAAWVRDGPKGEIRRVEVGDTLRGWKVTAVRDDSLGLSDGEREGQIELRVFREPGKAVAPPPPPPRRLPPKPVFRRERKRPKDS